MNWTEIFAEHRQRMLDAPGSGFGHRCVIWFDAKAAYMFALGSQNTDRDLLIAASINLAWCARALWFGAQDLGGVAFTQKQLSLTDAEVKQLGRWAAGTEADLHAVAATCTATDVPLRPSLLVGVVEIVADVTDILT